MAARMDEGDDFYDIMGLGKEREEATDRDIQKKFRELSKQLHPDLNPSADAKEKYQKVQAAYAVLSDRKKRKLYDMRGHEGLQQLEQSQRAQGQHGADVFSQLFGGAAAGGNPHKGPNAELALKVPLADIFKGATHRITITKQKICRRCRGSGAASKDAMKKCSHCNGQGHVIQRVQLMPGFVQQMQQQCPKCNGKGKVVSAPCPECRGHRTVRGDHVLEVDIERGVPEGFRLTHEMEADQNPDQIPGDVIFIVTAEQDATFKRRKNNKDLDVVVKLSLREALLGFKKRLGHMDGHEVVIQRDAVTQHGFELKVEGEGMPVHNVPSEKGDLYVTFHVALPRSLTDRQKEVLRDVLAAA